LRDYPHQFSGGMRQRVAIAIAMACAPELLIADEPTTSLDVTVQAQILEVLGDLSTASGTAVILITHDLGVVAGFCDRLLVMYAGRIVESGPTDAVVGEPRHPYTRGLLESIPRLQGPLPTRLRSVDGSPPEIGTFLPGCAFAPRCRLAMPVCREETPRLESAPGDGQAHHVVACHAVAGGYVPVPGTRNGEVPG
jgi:oligopeptide transport system ATP-binding protein